MCSISTMTFLAPWTRSIAPPMPLTILPGIIQLAMSPVAETCIAPEDRRVDLAAADHPEAGGRVEERRALAQGDGLLAGVDQVGVLLAVDGVGADAEDAVLGLQHDLDVVGHVVGHQRRQADAQVDVGAVGELGARRGRPSAHGSGPWSGLLALDAGCGGRSGRRGGTDGAALDPLVGGLAAVRGTTRWT